MKDKEMDVIRKTETKTKIIELYKKIKVTAIKIIATIKDEINYIKAYWEFVKTDTTAECKIPTSVFDALARVLLPDITAFFESEEGKKEYAEYVKATEEIKQKKAG